MENAAVMFLSLSIVSDCGLVVPLKSPPNAINVLPGSGAAVTVTTVPVLKRLPSGDSSGGGSNIIVPSPMTDVLTTYWRINVAEMVL